MRAKSILPKILFFTVVALLFVASFWAYAHFISEPELYTVNFTDHQLWEKLSFLPGVDASAHISEEPVKYVISSMQYLFILCFWPLLLLFAYRSLSSLPVPQIVANVIIRFLLLATIVAALLNIQKTSESSQVAVIYLVDVSDSMSDDALSQAHDRIQKQLAEMPENTTAKIITFAERPHNVTFDSPETLPPFERHAEENGTNAGQHTNIQDAIRYAYALFPADHVKRLVLISDGNQTEGDLLAEAFNANTQDVRIDSLNVDSETTQEVMIRNVYIKDRDNLRVGKPFEIEVEIFSTYNTTASFNVWQNETKDTKNSQKLDIVPGSQFLTLTTEPFSQGQMTCKFSLDGVEHDRYAANNQYEESLNVAGKPKVLYIEGNSKSSIYLQRALQGYGESTGQNVEVELRSPTGMPATMSDAQQFDAIILSDTPRVASSGNQNVTSQNMSVLNEYVRKTGGGFIAIGGENAFGLGGYENTPVEDMLPVQFKSDMKKDHPSVALAILIDKSGSMGGTKLDLAKEAAKSTVEALGNNDRIMVIGFDDEPYTVVPLTRAINRTSINNKIAKMRPDGGTNIEPALEMAYIELAMISAKVKHVILLTDGQSPYGSINQLVKQMSSDAITVSTVAVGSGADTVLLNKIANLGKGRSHFTNDPYAIPRIFLQEAEQLTNTAIVEEPFTPKVAKSHNMVKGLQFSYLLGYVTTKPKNGAEVILTAPSSAPILATWRWGSGKTTVFTSDAKNRWASAWINNNSLFPKFWAQVVRETMKTTKETRFDMNVEISYGKAVATIDAISDDDRFINGLQILAQITPPDAEPFEVPFRQFAPGLYDTKFDLSGFGTYKIDATLKTKEGNTLGTAQATLPYAYPTEFMDIEPNTELVHAAVAATDGKIDPDIPTLTNPGDARIRTFSPLWPYFLWLTLALIVLDVLFRRIRFGSTKPIPWQNVIQ